MASGGEDVVFCGGKRVEWGAEVREVDAEVVGRRHGGREVWLSD